MIEDGDQTGRKLLSTAVSWPLPEAPSSPRSANRAPGCLARAPPTARPVEFPRGPFAGCRPVSIRGMKVSLRPLSPGTGLPASSVCLLFDLTGPGTRNLLYRR